MAMQRFDPTPVSQLSAMTTHYCNMQASKHKSHCTDRIPRWIKKNPATIHPDKEKMSFSVQFSAASSSTIVFFAANCSTMQRNIDCLFLNQICKNQMQRWAFSDCQIISNVGLVCLWLNNFLDFSTTSEFFRSFPGQNFSKNFLR